MSKIEIRTPGEDEFTRFGEAVSTAFSEQLRDDELELARKIVDPSRDLAAYEAGVIVGTASSYSLSLKVPGGDVKAAGVSAVGVAPTHRRRGIMSSLMRRLHDEAHGREEPVAVLWAAEAPIYGRFGYGLGTINGRIDADRDRTMAGLQGDTSGSVRLVSKEEALDVLPSVYDRVRASTPGFIARDRIWWEVQRLADLEHWRNGSGPQFRAVLEREGRPEGYALYRLEHSWPEGFPGGTLHIQELLAADAAGWRDVWRFVFGIDLVARVKARSVAADDPIFLLAPEQARLRFRLGDGLWVRILDVAEGARGPLLRRTGVAHVRARRRVLLLERGPVAARRGVGNAGRRPGRQPPGHLSLRDGARGRLPRRLHVRPARTGRTGRGGLRRRGRTRRRAVPNRSRALVPGHLLDARPSRASSKSRAGARRSSRSSRRRPRPQGPPPRRRTRPCRPVRPGTGRRGARVAPRSA